MTNSATDSAPLLRRLRWRTRYWLSPIYPWEGNLLARWTTKGWFTVHPDTPRAVFNAVVLGIANRLGESLPVEFVLTPVNIKRVVDSHTASYDAVAQYDDRELWHRVSRRMRQIGEPFDAQLGRARKPHRLRIRFWHIHRHEIRVRIEEGEPLPLQEELEQRLGLPPGTLRACQSVDLG